MQLCDGVVVVLDGKATPFTRIWCDFEYATVVKMDDAERPGKGRLLLDIATARSGNSQSPQGGDSDLLRLVAGFDSDSDFDSAFDSDGAQVLTGGLAPAEQGMEAKRQKNNGFGKSGWLAKSKREEGFPIEVVREALKKISVVNAEASKKEDKKHILNSIAGREGSGLDLEPLATHPQYDEVDQTLKSIFAEAAIRKAAAEGESLTEFTKALREGTARKALRFTFSELENFSAEDMKAVAEGLPEKLEPLTAAFEGCIERLERFRQTFRYSPQLGGAEVPELREGEAQFFPRRALAQSLRELRERQPLGHKLPYHRFGENALQRLVHFVVLLMRC